VVDEHLNSDNQSADTLETAQLFEKVDPPESRFLFVDVAALRAKQLRRGARPRLAGMADGTMDPSVPHPQKPERVAMEEVRQGLVSYEIVEVKPEPTGGE
jgi:DNA-directed RNA polymerase subunit K/omega